MRPAKVRWLDYGMISIHRNRICPTSMMMIHKWTLLQRRHRNRMRKKSKPHTMQKLCTNESICMLFFKKYCINVARECRCMFVLQCRRASNETKRHLNLCFLFKSLLNRLLYGVLQSMPFVRQIFSVFSLAVSVVELFA